jgi:hypothetical protein
MGISAFLTTKLRFRSAVLSKNIRHTRHGVYSVRSAAWSKCKRPVQFRDPSKERDELICVGAVIEPAYS